MEPVDLLSALLEISVGETRGREDLVLEGLASVHAGCRDVAVDLAGRNLRLFAPDLLRLWFCDPARRVTVETLLLSDPLLVLESRRPDTVSREAPRANGPAVQAWFVPDRVRRILQALADACPRMDGEAFSLLERLPGLAQQAAFSPDSPFDDADRARLGEWIARREAIRFPAQIAVVPSYRCNRSCAYCFTRGLAERMPGEMTVEDLRSLLDAAGDDVTRVNIFGGEPTRFAGLPALAAEIARRGKRFYFSTNGTCDPREFARLVSSPGLEMVTLHVERPEWLSREERAATLENVRILGRAPIQTVLRYNLVEASRRDWDFLADYIEAASGAVLSFAVAFPSADRSNEHAGANEIAKFAPKISAFARRISEDFPGVPRLVLCKPFPLCAFSESDLADLFGRVEYHAICEIHRRGFTDQIIAHPDLTIGPCMAVTAETLRLPGPRPRAEMGRAFAENLRPLMSRPLLDACGSCSLFAAGVCQAACYAYAQ